MHEEGRASGLPVGEATRRAQDLRADLTSRGVHPDVLRFCRAELVADNYFHAVLEATKSIADKLRVRSGFTDDGAPLVDRTLCGETPKISINHLLTESQKSEQKGFANLVKGTFGMFRNPSAHEAPDSLGDDEGRRRRPAIARVDDPPPPGRRDRSAVSYRRGFAGLSSG